MAARRASEQASDSMRRIQITTAFLVFAIVAPARAASRADANENTSIALVIHIGAPAGAPVVEEAWLRERVEQATTLFAPAGVSFAIASLTYDADFGDIRTVADRDARAGTATGRPIHIFVAGEVFDKDRSGALIAGVHWRYQGPSARLRARRYILLGRIARPSTLGHELGHYFGLAHRSEPENVMTAPDRTPEATFDAAQITRLRRRLGRGR